MTVSEYIHTYTHTYIHIYMHVPPLRLRPLAVPQRHESGVLCLTLPYHLARTRVADTEEVAQGGGLPLRVSLLAAEGCMYIGVWCIG